MSVPKISLKPLIYGYMRVANDLPEADVEQMELVLRDYAEREGYCFVTTFCEYVGGSQGAFSELVDALKRAEAHHIIVPVLDHLAHNPYLRESMIARLQYEAQAIVIALGGTR